MARTDNDSWDLASSVGATATMVAVGRALASRAPDALIDDPYAEPLVRAVGIEFFTKLLDGDVDPAVRDDIVSTSQPMTEVMAVRTRFFDDFFTEAADAGIEQAVILASGLDSRAYRLAWADTTIVYEIDQPAVIEFKTRTLSEAGATPTAERRTVAVDLRDDWPTALTRAGFDPTRPTAWSAEGLLIYLPPEAQDRLFDDITALSAPGSRLATEYHPDGAAALSDQNQTAGERFREHGLDLDITTLTYPGPRHHVGDYLSERGWQIDARTRPEVFSGYGRVYPDADTVAGLRGSIAIVATRT